jgi:ferritin heavy chain
MEKDVNHSLLNLSKIASQNDDPEMEDFISQEFLHEQVEDIKYLADLITQLNLAGSTGLGLYLFDKQMHEGNH